MTIINPLPYTFFNGTVADATQVDADFNQIVANVNANGAHSGANSDITSLTALSTPLSTAQGGTGRTTGVPSFLAFSNGSANSVAGTQYFTVARVDSNEGLVPFGVPVGGTLRNMYAKSGAAPTGSESYTFTLRKNGVSQALTCRTLGGASASQDIAHSVTVVAGDLITVQLVVTGGAISTGHQVSFEFDVNP